jgi:hypothetical protein
MSEDNDPIGRSLGLSPFVETNQQLAPLTSADHVEDDYQYVRENVKSLVDNGQIAIGDLVGLAKASQNPRMYEVLATMISSVTNANKQLLDSAKTHRELARRSDQGPTTINNNLNITTAALLDIIKKANNGSAQ